MATILVVDDRPTNREFLVTLFGYANHRCLEAKDGAEALTLARSERPDLIVTDLLMPTMDGHEFVQHLRSDPALAAMKVIFYSATYTVPEARAMAEDCGVRTVLPKPSDPEVILDAVNREMGLVSPTAPRPHPRMETVDLTHALEATANVDPSLEAAITDLRSTAHLLEEIAQGGEALVGKHGELRPLSERLSANLARLRKATSRRVAIDDLCVRLLSERHPAPMIELFTHAAGKILDAPRASVCVLDGREEQIVHLTARGGLDPLALRAAALDRSSLPGSLLLAREPVRISTNRRLRTPSPPEAFGDGSFLGLAIRTGSQLHGWICLGRAANEADFDAEEERIARSLAARLAVVYENAMLYDTVQRHAARLQAATGERERSRARVIESEQRFRQIAESIKEVFWLTDPAKNEMLYISPAYEEIWGRRAESLYTSPRGWLEAIHPDDQARVAHAIETRQREGTYDEEYRIIRPDGSVRWISDKAFPVVDAAGAVDRLAGVAEDITARREAQAEVSRINRALTMLSNCNEALIRAEMEESLLDSICRIAVEKGGYRSARVGFARHDDRKSIEILAHAGHFPDFLHQMPLSWATDRADGHGPASRAIQSGEPVLVGSLAEEPELRERERDIRAADLGPAIYLPLKDGQGAFGILALQAPSGIRVGEDEIRLLVELADDLAFGITSIRARKDRERAEAALAASLKEKEALLREVHHRVKNNMQVITSLLRLESNRLDHPITRSVLRDMQNRIQAMAALHETLYRSGNFAQVDLADYLRRVVAHLKRSLVPTPGQISFLLELEPIIVDLDRAIPCGLVLNELASNSVKHAFPEGRLGEVWIDLRRVDPATVGLSVRDNGAGLPADWEARVERSLGVQLVTDLARQLGGRLAIGPDARFEITFPAEFQTRPALPRV
ncbi:MAG: PAS domain-containing protein [Vicinamibacteria bacterium]|nr:PAS domain-containing protein [Vicinamibacteria bacterium]